MGPGDHRPADRPAAGVPEDELADDSPAPDDSPAAGRTDREVRRSAGEGAAGVSEETAARAMAGDEGAEQAVEQAWDEAEPMEGEAPTG